MDPSTRQPTIDQTRDDTLDNALEEIHRFDAEWLGGLSSHGPMVVEALDHIGRPEAIEPWLRQYLTHFEPAPTPRSRPDPRRWADELGRNRDVAGWTALFGAELDEAHWSQVVERWVPRLTAGLITAATHGVLRTAHAARGLGRDERHARLAELANGLGYWAARYEQIPGACPEGATPLATAWSDVPLIGADGREAWLISDRFRQLDVGFATATARAALPDDPGRAITEIVSLGARMLVANPQAPIAFVHAVTAPASLRTLAPLLDDATTRRALGEAWVAVAALWAAYGEQPPIESAERGEREPPGWAVLVDTAIALGDEHGVKVTVAAHDEAQAGGDDLLMRLAADVFLGAMQR